MAEPLTITAITADPREPDLRAIKAGRRFIARVRRRDIEHLSLAVGTPIDSDTQAALERCQQRASLRLRAIRSLSRAAASRQRLFARLAEQAEDPETLDEILDELATDGLLDDRATATRIAEEQLRTSPVGRAALCATLQRRGFERDLVEQIVADLLGGRDEYADAKEAAEVAMRSLRHLPPDTAARRLAARLGRKGFSEDAITEVIGSRLRREPNAGHWEPEVDHGTPPPG